MVIGPFHHGYGAFYQGSGAFCQDYGTFLPASSFRPGIGGNLSGYGANEEGRYKAT